MLLTALALGAAAPLRLSPIDECNADPTFVQFRRELRQIIRRRDRSAMLRILPDRLGYGLPGQAGTRDSFVTAWGGKDFRASFWTRLGDILSRGCVIRDGRASLPSLPEQLGRLNRRDPRRFDSYTTGIARPGTILRARPSNRSAIIARLNWHILLGPEDTGDDNWIAVRLTNGRKGYVTPAAYHGAIGDRIQFEKRDGSWIMTGWVSGD